MSRNSGKKQRLELTWVGKDQQPKLEPRILIEDPEKSYGDKHTDNMLIFGDNLLALKALEQDYTGKIKCIYIDPPFNADAATLHYEDNIEHSVWLSLMRDRLDILYRLLSNDGTLFVHIDDNELAYLIVVLDEIFGRSNRSYLVTFKQGAPTGHKAINPGCVNTTNYILIYCKDKTKWMPNKLFTGRGRDNRYNQYIVNINENYENWKFISLTKAFSEHLRVSEKDARAIIKDDPNTIENFVIEHAEHVVRLARPDYKNVSEDARKMIDASNADKNQILCLERDNHSNMYFIKGERILFYKDKLKLIDGQYVSGEPLTTLWDDLLSNNLHAEGGVNFPKGKKPEALIKRVFELATNVGDLVLDSFGGSGTTGAVAHKMGRKWIMVELGEHCDTHIVPRMQKVIDGTDQGGISQAVDWQRGGGFKYYHLAPSLLKKDPYGNWVIDETYNADMLAAAMAKQEGFRYQPDEEIYWKQGRSTEKDFIFTTTSFVTTAMLDKIAEELQADESLLVCCKSFQQACEQAHSNITIKKIPKMLLGRCEFGKEDYSLNIINLPSLDSSSDIDGIDDTEDFSPDEGATTVSRNGKSKKSNPDQSRLQLSLLPE